MLASSQLICRTGGRASDKNTLSTAHGAQPLAGAYYVYDGFSDNADKRAIANRMAGVRLSNPRVDDMLVTTPMSELAPNGSHGWPMPDKTLLDPSFPSSLVQHHWTDEVLGSSGSLALWHGRIRHWVPPHQGDLARVMIGMLATPNDLLHWCQCF